MACDSGPALRDMTPPKADVAGQTSQAPTAAAVSSCLRLETLKQRADFLRAAKARRIACTAFLLQARETGTPSTARVGFTCSKKIGNAVARNRAKRRLRAVARAVMPAQALPGWDYVLVGRPGATVSHDFAAMCDELHSALRKLHGGRA
jgi:ribonuclease P protein component